MGLASAFSLFLCVRDVLFVFDCAEFREDYFSCAKQKQGPGWLLEHWVSFPTHLHLLVFAF